MILKYLTRAVIVLYIFWIRYLDRKTKDLIIIICYIHVYFYFILLLLYRVKYLAKLIKTRIVTILNNI